MALSTNTKDLWQRAKDGDASAFERLFARQSEWLLIFVRARLGTALRGKIEPEDVLQDAYVAALKGFEHFDYTDDEAFRKWMCQIVNNRLRDTHDYFAAKKRQGAPIPRSDPTGPVTAVRRAENRQRVEAAIEKLSDEHREVVLLRYFEGLSAEEAGRRMNRTPGAIRSLSTRALVELGKQLGTTAESR